MVEAGSAIGKCAVHPERAAAITCTRCGNFACEACTGEPGGAELCAACRARAGGTIAWEHREEPLWRRYLDTTSAALRAPTSTFGGLGEGELAPSVVFGVLSSLIGFSPLVLAVIPLAIWMAARRPEAGDGLSPLFLFAVPCAALLYPALSFFYFTSIGALFHVAARIAGGRATIAQSLRAAYYTSAWEPVSALTLCVYCVPFLGLLAVLGASAGGAVWRGLALKAYAQRAHGLPSGPATVVAVIATGTWFTLWIAMLVLVVGFAIYQRFSR